MCQLLVYFFLATDFFAAGFGAGVGTLVPWYILCTLMVLHWVTVLPLTTLSRQIFLVSTAATGIEMLAAISNAMIFFMLFSL